MENKQAEIPVGFHNAEPRQASRGTVHRGTGRRPTETDQAPSENGCGHHVGPTEARPCERAGLGTAPKATALTVVLALVSALFAVPASAADCFAKPGDAGQIQFQIQHLTESGGDIASPTVTVNAPAQFIVKGSSILGPLDAAPSRRLNRLRRLPYHSASERSSL